MALANLANAPLDDNGLNEFSFAHADLVTRTISYLNANKGTNIVVQQLDPVPTFDLNNWLLRVQYTHNNINDALKLKGSDLTGLDINKPEEVKAWTWLVFTDAQAWASATGVT